MWGQNFSLRNRIFEALYTTNIKMKITFFRPRDCTSTTFIIIYHLLLKIDIPFDKKQKERGIYMRSSKRSPSLPAKRYWKRSNNSYLFFVLDRLLFCRPVHQTMREAHSKWVTPPTWCLNNIFAVIWSVCELCHRCDRAAARRRMGSGGGKARRHSRALEALRLIENEIRALGSAWDTNFRTTIQVQIKQRKSKWLLYKQWSDNERNNNEYTRTDSYEYVITVADWLTPHRLAL